MTARKMILLIAAVLVPGGLLIVVLRCRLRSSLGERFLKRGSIMQNLALVTRDLYYFYEKKNTGVSRFQVEATPDGRFPVDQAAGLLAIYCMLLGQSPERLRGNGVSRKRRSKRFDRKKRKGFSRLAIPSAATSRSLAGKRKCFPVSCGVSPIKRSPPL